ncbi:UTP--glucose-1-phosphate uridylyltransferase GalU [Candidatus Erwinia haradaeae]|uniref:UTP--glucose-1-phosphate uridylyltransferase n=1 Tax=Candidatus Erwinia haradaeae TaxID=1922217 RepID=A0A451DGT5_9GAMM|nr:UTP--glucose-1-phosphate uridylyltransferase GalU [Candidatus Erwinia haradaeae]VFP85849.1 UTP--glucose-1-phosphate uridylyltransferase [Candidatus Erwinia haradaeae]
MSTGHLKIKQAVIPVAGWGTRMLPATKAIPKEMLPLVDKPLIQYVVNECIMSGINNIILVTHASKSSIANHFDTNCELETMLERHSKQNFLKEIQSICPPSINIMEVRQGIPRGLGHAIMCARPLIGNHPIAIMLPDVILDQRKSDLSRDNLAEMIKRFHRTRCSQIMVKPVIDVTTYGIVDCFGETLTPGDSKIITSIIEKPNINQAPSNLAVVGRYVLSEKIWPLLTQIYPKTDKEIQLTDALSLLIEKEAVQAYCLKGKSYDCGNKFGYIKAFVTYAMHHKKLGNDFKIWIKKALDDLNH